MKAFPFAQRGERLTVLALGAHSDDIEIGAGGTLLTWIGSGLDLTVHWCVLSAAGTRRDEAQRSGAAFLQAVNKKTIEIGSFRDGYFPHEIASIKDWFEALKQRVAPDVVLTHRHDDAHQDHRVVAELTTNTFRDHLTLSYEVPKWDGDFGQPACFVPLSEAVMQRKVALLQECFGSQRSKDWFDADVFRGLARLRGMECRAPERFAEAFYCKKMVIA